jgi:hypothetical protein
MNQFEEKLLETLEGIRKELVIMNTPVEKRKDQRMLFEILEILPNLYKQKEHAIRDDCAEELESIEKKISDTKKVLIECYDSGMVTK